MNNIQIINFRIQNDINRIISCDLCYPAKLIQKIPLIIISHGFKGWKDWGFFPFISERFAHAGAFVACFNFSLNGNPLKDSTISDLNGFAKNTISQEVNDLESVIRFFSHDILSSASSGISDIYQYPDFINQWNGEIYLIGHSLGGGVSLIDSTKNSLVKKVVLWASVGKFDRYSTRQKKIWHEKGFMEFYNQRTGQLLKMNVTYLEDIEKYKQEYDLTAIISNLDCEVLIVHGKQDLTVPMKEIRQLIETKNTHVQSEIIEKTGHTFGIEHPFQKSTKALEKAINLTINFFSL